MKNQTQRLLILSLCVLISGFSLAQKTEIKYLGEKGEELTEKNAWVAKMLLQYRRGHTEKNPNMTAETYLADGTQHSRIICTPKKK